MIKQLLLMGVVFSIACLFSLLLTPCVRYWMKRFNIVDMPDARRVNTTPIPRSGGLAIVIAFFITASLAVCCAPFFHYEAVLTPAWMAFAGCSLVLVAVGFWDDCKGLPALFRLMVQIGVASIMYSAGVAFHLPSAWGEWTACTWVTLPLTIAWFIGLINAFNLIDGLDGLASGLAIIASLGMLGVSFYTGANFNALHPLMLPIFIGSILGFLRYNYNPASIFMGDSGSLFIGFSLATFALLLGRADAFVVSFGLPVLCLGIPMTDTFLAILRRTLRYVLYRKEGKKDGVMTADRNHVHHRLLSFARGNQRRAVLGLYGLAVALVVLGFISIVIKESKASIFLIGFAAFAYVIVRFMTEIELWDAGRLLSKPGSRMGRRTLAIPLYILADLVVMASAHLGLYFVLNPMLPTFTTGQHFNIFLIYVVPVALLLVFTQAYHRIWGRSTRKDSLMLVMAVFVGSLLSHIVISFVRPDWAHPLIRFHLLWALIVPLPMLGVRLLKSAFLQFLATAENRLLKKRSLHDTSIERILFYGAGINLRAYVTLYELNVTRNHAAMLGALDDNPGVRGRVFRDLPILGPLEYLEDKQHFERLKPTKILISTAAMRPERLEEIKAFCKAKGLKLTQFEQFEQQLYSPTEK
ncbi:MAG: hypothetical protein Q4F99_00265 [bacterium]|nr:hypothetical protein [bacterium]